MEKPTEAEEMAEEEAQPKNSLLFPLLPFSESFQQSKTTGPQWLCNTSFTTDLSVVNEALSSGHNLNIDLVEHEEGKGETEEEKGAHKRSSHELLESSESDSASEDRQRRDKKKTKKQKKRRKGLLEEGTTYAIGSRKSGVRAWTNSESKISKDYYFDSRGDRDNLAFGCLYRLSFYLPFCM